MTDADMYVTCPFCGEADFDKPGLKLHFLRGWCEQFEATENITPMSERFLCKSEPNT